MWHSSPLELMEYRRGGAPRRHHDDSDDGSSSSSTAAAASAAPHRDPPLNIRHQSVHSVLGVLGGFPSSSTGVTRTDPPPPHHHAPADVPTQSHRSNRGGVGGRGVASAAAPSGRATRGGGGGNSRRGDRRADPPAPGAAPAAATTATGGASSLENHLCQLCYNAPRDVRFIPCRHHYACRGCASRLDSRCPVCQATFRSLEACAPSLPTFGSAPGSARGGRGGSTRPSAPDRAATQRGSGHGSAPAAASRGGRGGGTHGGDVTPYTRTTVQGVASVRGGGGGRGGLDSSRTTARGTTSAQGGSGSTPSAQPNQAPRELTVAQLDAVSALRQVDIVGTGGFGIVYRGRIGPRAVAVKIPTPVTASVPGILAAYDGELRVLSRLAHPNVVPLLAFCRGPDNNRKFALVFPLLRPLTEAMTSMSAVERVSVLCDLSRGIEYLHDQNFVHRDIKPANVLLDETGCAKIADLGLARVVPAGASHLSTARGGTPWYMDPAARGREARKPSDLYSFGITIAALFARRDPASDEDARSMISSISDRGWKDLAQRCCAPEATRASAREARLAAEQLAPTLQGSQPQQQQPALARPRSAAAAAAGGSQDYDQLVNLSNVAVPARASAVPQTVLYTATANDGDECSVCTDEIVAREEVRSLPCGHTFHKACIDPWFTTHHSCPTCRHDIHEARAVSASASHRHSQRH